MKSHLLQIRAQNQHGVLGKVTNLLRRRMFNIEGLTAGATEQNGISHITVEISKTENFSAEQAKKQLSKIIETINVRDVDEHFITREIALFRIHFSQKNKTEILALPQMTNAKIIACEKKSIVVEFAGLPSEIDNFYELVKNFGVSEFTRSSVIAIRKG